jgi:tRNA A-37 threonylcarbamoyl transferase component Bud32
LITSDIRLKYSLMNPNGQKVKGLALLDGWKGLAVQSWSDFFFTPSRLLQNPLEVYKTEGRNITLLKQVEHGGKKVSIVVKKSLCRNRLRNLLALIRPPKAVRNFNLAISLMDKQIDAAAPIAALWRKKGLQELENIQITEFCQASLSLYDVAYGKNKEIIYNLKIRKDVIRQIAFLVAKLHKMRFWHRDSKAGNFIVYKSPDGSYKAKLIDLDGIKLNLFNRQSNRVRTLSKLAESLTRFKTVNVTDFYRGFLFYCDAMQIDGRSSREFFREVQRASVASRLLTIISDSYKFKDV